MFGLAKAVAGSVEWPGEIDLSYDTLYLKSQPVYTSARRMNVRLPEHLDLIAAAPDGIQKLRGLILELAVRGKLVPQDQNDEPASELLKRIAKERARREEEGTCKKSKAMPPPEGDDEPPFEFA